MNKEEYNKIVDDLHAGGATPSLKVFRECMKYDDNFVWRIPDGHIVNALEEAIDEADRWEDEANIALELLQAMIDIAKKLNLTLLELQDKLVLKNDDNFEYHMQRIVDISEELGLPE